MASTRYQFRLKNDRDADIKEWLDSLGEGECSHYIRQALRAYRQARQVSPGPVIDPGAALLEYVPAEKLPPLNVSTEDAEAQINTLIGKLKQR